MPERVIQTLHAAIDAFENAVKAHHKAGMLDSKILLKEELERARTRLLETVAKIVDESAAES